MGEPAIASRTPFGVDVEAGKTYWWCRCGLSQKQPFCDGTHKGGEFAPLKFEATESKKVWFCGCKRSANKPLCDGSHKALSPGQ
jgi:CDGSH iron-sulfur domain-containing protein 3